MICRLIHHVAQDRNISTTVGLIALKFCADVTDPQRMNPTDFGNPLSFSLMLSGVHIFSLLSPNGV